MQRSRCEGNDSVISGDVARRLDRESSPEWRGRQLRRADPGRCVREASTIPGGNGIGAVPWLRDNADLCPQTVLLGRPLRNENLHDELLPKRIALPVFCSDPLSSVAYATEEILLVLSLGGLALLHLAPWVAAARRLAAGRGRRVLPADLPRLPHGGGAYVVSRENLGRQPGARRRDAPCSSTTC